MSRNRREAPGRVAGRVAGSVIRRTGASAAGWVAAGLAVVALLGSACTPDKPAPSAGHPPAKSATRGSTPAASPKTSAPSKPTPSPTPTPTPTPLPSASDGRNLRACTDGRCEVELRSGDRLTVPRSYGVSGLHVTTVGGGTLRLKGQVHGGLSGGCAGSGRCDVVGSGSGFTMTIGPGVIARENGLGLAVVAIHGPSAIVRITPG